jgi:hypothetical protein
MRTIRTLFYAAVALALFAASVLTIGWVVRTAVGWIGSQDSQVVAASIAFLGTVTAGIGAVVISQQRTKSREIAEAHRPVKADLYMAFITEIVGTLRKGAGESELSPQTLKHLEDFFYDFTMKAMMWGSPGVLRAYTAFRRAGENPNVVFLVDDVLRAMRKDLGLRNRGLQRGDLIKLLITDPEELDKLLAKH